MTQFDNKIESTKSHDGMDYDEMSKSMQANILPLHTHT